MKKQVITAILFIGFSSASLAVSFDCAKASTANEKMICGNQELSALDDQVFALYKGLVSLNPNLKTAQREWVKTTRQCSDLDCLKDAYKSRVEELNAMSEPKKVDVSQAQAAIQQIVQSTVQQEVQSASSQEEQASLETTQETTSNNETTQSEVQAYVADDSSRNNAELTNEDVKQSDSSTGSSIRIIIALLLTLAIASVPFIGFKKRKALKTA
jgi:uncharacterized protein